jgi:hypothetical protein
MCQRNPIPYTGTGGDVVITGYEAPSYSLGFVVFKLDVQTVLDPDFHLDGHIRIWWHSETMDPDVLLLNHVAQSPVNRTSQKVSIVR